MSAAPMTAPTAMPAIAPPESPDLDPADALEVVLGVEVELLVGNSGGIDIVVGNSTPTQRASTFELMQHELVELTVLSAQYEHSPCKFEP
jgi:hypothetical protein